MIIVLASKSIFLRSKNSLKSQIGLIFISDLHKAEFLIAVKMTTYCLTFKVVFTNFVQVQTLVKYPSMQLR